ncbi:MAG: hypothetical protein ACTSY1_10125, partial [Alphaproteobacteria bacterium]
MNSWRTRCSRILIFAWFLGAVAVAVGWPPASQAWAQVQFPNVVVSIKPIHSLVAGVMEGVGRPKLLVAATSPHAF